MDYIWEGFLGALNQIISFDPETMDIVGLSLNVSGMSVFISACIGIPFGVLLGLYQFRGKGIVIRIVYTFMSLPPVICGLFVFLILMRRGPFGQFQLNFTVAAMVIAQVLLIIPLVTGLTYNLVRDKAPIVSKLGTTLGGSRLSTIRLLIFEMRYGLIAAIISGFGRAISEVGAVMIVGGNITGKTRVMTTYIAELKSMGDYSRAIAVGLILLFIAFVVNAILYNIQHSEQKANAQ